MAKKPRPTDDLPAKRRKRRSTSAADSYRGYSLQATRCLHHLLSAEPPGFVSLEILDDVSVDRKNGKRLVEQDKSYLASNPLSDRAEAFWKTLRNWVDAIATGQLDPELTRFLIYAPKAKPGMIAQLFASATDADAIAEAIKQMGVVANEPGDAEWQQHARVVAAADPVVLSKMVRNLAIDTPTGSPSDTLPPLFASKLISSDFLDDAIKWAHGWVKNTIDSLLEQSKPACISYNDFHAALLNFVQNHDRCVMLRTYAGTPDTADIDDHLAFRCYVRQLRIIDLSDVDLLEAVNDYLRASIDRTEWARRGLVTEASLNSFGQELETTWRNKKRRVSIAHANDTAQNQGQMLYSDCLEHRLSLDALETPPAFLRGSLHALADDRTIGWHPDYVTVLDQQNIKKEAAV